MSVSWYSLGPPYAPCGIVASLHKGLLQFPPTTPPPTRRVCSQVASAFSQMLNLHNLSEEISNAQIEKASRIGEVIMSPGLCVAQQMHHCISRTICLICW